MKIQQKISLQLDPESMNAGIGFFQLSNLTICICDDVHPSGLEETRDPCIKPTFAITATLNEDWHRPPEMWQAGKQLADNKGDSRQQKR